MGFLNDIIVQVIAGIVLIILIALWGPSRRFIWKVIKKACLMVKKQPLSDRLKEYTKPLEERISKLENEMRLLEDRLQQRFDRNMKEINTKILTELSLQNQAAQKIDELNGKFIKFEEKAERKMTRLRAEIDRTLAYHCRSVKLYDAAVLWFLRWANKSILFKNKEYIKFGITGAISDVKRMTPYKFDANHELEIHNIITNIRKYDSAFNKDLDVLEDLLHQKKYSSTP